MKREKGIRKIINFRLFAFLLGVMILGAVVGTYLYAHKIAFFCILGVGCICVLIFAFLSKIRLVGIILIIGFILPFVTAFSLINDEITYQPTIRGEIVKVRIESVSVDSDIVFCKIISGLKNPPRGEGLLTINSEFDSEVLNEGMEVLLSGVKIERNPMFTKEGNLYVKYFTSASKYEIEAESVVECVANTGGVSDRLRNGLRKAIRENLDEERGGIVFALITGDKYGIDSSVYSGYRSSGVAHILAVSGLHVVFLSQLIEKILSKLKIRKRYSFFLILPILLGFNAVCDFSPSVVRASVMTLVGIGVPMVTRRRYDSLSAMCFSGVILVALNPFTVYNYGFILSFLCVLGITAFYRKLERVLSFLPKFIRESLSMSISATLGVFPVALLLFKEYSFIGIVANLFILPVLSLCYGVLLITALMVAVIPSLGFLLKSSSFFVYYLNYATKVLGSVEFGRISGYIPLSVIVSYYGLGITLTDFVMIESRQKWVTGTVLGLVFFAWAILL